MGTNQETANMQSSAREFLTHRKRRALATAVAGAALLDVAIGGGRVPFITSPSNSAESVQIFVGASGKSVAPARRISEVGGPLQVSEDCGENDKPVCYDPIGSELGYFPEICHDERARPVDGFCLVDFKNKVTPFITVPYEHNDQSADR